MLLPSLVSSYPYDDRWEGYEVKRDETYRVLWIWHGFNIRVICLPHEDGAWGYDFAWCYARDPKQVEAAIEAWDMATQDEPDGWHKRPTPDVRQAPRRDELPEHNRLRCRHGSYVHAGCRTLNCPDTDGRMARPLFPEGEPAR
ncbi:hypothetical protein [Streptomyces sp. NPDC059916]|uniref:hypothetical protein n=1 Tax=Streptomyces sp. NPDC059916 TaxID=3347001 RepID=UPI0036A0F096